MKIIVRSKEKVKEKTIIDDIELGIIFQYDTDGPIALKLENNKVLLLTYTTGDTWLELNDNMSFKNADIKILGRLDKIVVVKE